MPDLAIAPADASPARTDKLLTLTFEHVTVGDVLALSEADDVSYDNAASGLEATTVKSAIDELAGEPHGSGDVVGPAGAVDGNLAVFDGATGKLLKDGGTPASRSPNIQTTASAGTVTPTFDNDLVTITAQAAALTLANPTGTEIPGLGMAIRIKDNGTARAISYGTQYRAIGVTLPTSTVVSKTLYLAMIYNATDTMWDVVAVGQQA